MKMLEVEKAKNDRVALVAIGFGSAYVEGTVTEVHDAGKPFVSYTVAWDDNEYADEQWGADELDEVTIGKVQDHNL
jgi:hypothetical protein